MELFVTKIFGRVFTGTCNRNVNTSIHPKIWIIPNLVQTLKFSPLSLVLGRCMYLGPIYNIIVLETSFITVNTAFVVIPKLLAVTLNVPQYFK